MIKDCIPATNQLTISFCNYKQEIHLNTIIALLKKKK